MKSIYSLNSLDFNNLTKRGFQLATFFGLTAIALFFWAIYT